MSAPTGQRVSSPQAMSSESTIQLEQGVACPLRAKPDYPETLTNPYTRKPALTLTTRKPAPTWTTRNLSLTRSTRNLSLTRTTRNLSLTLTSGRQTLPPCLCRLSIREHL
jgi:hypothetical protein